MEAWLGCSVADYLRVEGRMGLTEALASEDYRGVQFSAREEEVVSLLKDRDPPQPLPPPPRTPVLSCALCQEEFEDWESRAGHYSLHARGQIVRPRPLPVFSCLLCGAQSDSVEDRRDHYLLVHCPPQTSSSFNRER